MHGMIKTNKSWQRHLPKRPQKVKRDYYNTNRVSYQKTVVRIILVILVLLLVQSIFQIKYFKIEKINLVGQNDLSVEEVQQFIISSLTKTKFFFFEETNYWLAPIDELSYELKEKYNLEEAKIEKKWPDSLLVTVKEKVSHFIWQKDDSLYLLDAQGLLNRQISVLDDKDLVLEDKRDYRPQGEQIFTTEEIEVINQIYLNWNDLIAPKVKMSKITIYNDWNIDLHTETGFYVKIDKDQDIKEQLNNLRAVLEENITGVDIDYIDIRFGDKVYFK